jgi:hypothetical protein
MKDFISLYQKDPSAAKAMYYEKKVKINVGVPEGQH